MLRKKFYAVLIPVIVLAVAVPLPFGFATESISPNEGLTFLKNVAQLDMTKYTITLTSGPSTQYRESLGGLPELTMTYSLQSETSKLAVGFIFINDTLTGCFILVNEGSPQYAQPMPSDSFTSASLFLERYRAFTGESSFDTMRDLLDSIDASTNTSKTSGNMKLTVLVTDTTSFDWKNIYNGAIFSGLGVSFQNGGFVSFHDDRSYVQIGSKEVNIPKEEAIGKALGSVRGFAYTFGGETISNFTFLQDRITAALLTKAKDKPLILYPYWQVTMPLNDLYPGFVTMIVVEIWADTSEVMAVYPLGIGGDLPDDSGVSPSPSPQSSSAPSEEPSSSPEVSTSPSVSPESSASPLPFSTTQPTAFPSQSTQPSQPSSQQPAENSGNSSAFFDAGLVFAVAAVFAVAVAVSRFVLRRRNK